MSAVKLEQLKLETLGVVDPKIEVLFQKHVRHVVEDCMNRPHDGTARTISVEFALTPIPNPDDGSCDEVHVAVAAKSKVPTFRTKAFPMRPTKAGLLFNREVPENLDQPALGFNEGDDE